LDYLSSCLWTFCRVGSSLGLFVSEVENHSRLSVESHPLAWTFCQRGRESLKAFRRVASPRLDFLSARSSIRTFQPHSRSSDTTALDIGCFQDQPDIRGRFFSAPLIALSESPPSFFSTGVGLFVTLSSPNLGLFLSGPLESARLRCVRFRFPQPCLSMSSNFYRFDSTNNCFLFRSNPAPAPAPLFPASYFPASYSALTGLHHWSPACSHPMLSAGNWHPGLDYLSSLVHQLWTLSSWALRLDQDHWF
jgi:hypothetical protein